MRQLLATSRMTAVLMMIGLGVLILMAGLDLGGAVPLLPQGTRKMKDDQLFQPMRKAEEMLGTNATGLRLLGPGISPFYTTHFQPPPPPKAATTQKLPLVYHGYYQTASGQKQGFIKAGEQLSLLAPGAKVVGDWLVESVEVEAVILKNGAGKIHRLPFNARTEIDVPAP